VQGNDDNLISAPLAIAGLGAAPASLSPNNPKNLLIFGKSIKLELEGKKRQNTSVNRNAAAKQSINIREGR
jgi:hypothetical protein